MESEAHRDATVRLRQACAEEGRCSRRLAAAAGTRDEVHAAAQLEAAHAQVVAREAWIDWVRRGE